MFTLAHLSDIHLAPLPRPNFLRLTGKRWTGYINWQRRRRYVHDRGVLAALVKDMKAQAPDHIALTGDVINIGLPAEYRLGRVFLDSLGAPADISVVPGNHDIYVRSSEAYALQFWGPFMRGDRDESFPYVRKRGPLSLIGVSSGVPTAAFQATGSLGTEQLARLGGALDAAAAEKQFRVVMIHHPPVSLAPSYKRLTDAEGFKRVIAQYGAELVLHGHDHVEMINRIDGPDGTRVPVIGVPSASAAPGMEKDSAAYHLYRVTGEAGDWRVDMDVRGMDANGNMTDVKQVTL